MPKLTLHHLATLAHSPAEAPVLYVNESDELDVWAEALAPNDRIVLTREQLVEAMGDNCGTPGEQWDELSEGWTHEDVLAELEEVVNDAVEGVLATQ
ncbi:hypothetical protein [Streptomyces zaomyceticus]|uniref:hypothetical protein n=1 Tax=Streptomyces zaomyceticus TaxID=68286 RepID=UPI002E11263C|nr:hypothetical protein OG237_15835 [Streptomyces zaomyceticus]